MKFPLLLLCVPFLFLNASATTPPPGYLPRAGVDPTFAPDLRVVNRGDIEGLLPMPDGGLLAFGSWHSSHNTPPEFSADGQSRFGLIRIDRTGTVDASWGAALFSVPGTAVAAAVVSPAGKVYLYGAFPIGSGNRLLRLNANGSLDSSFTPPADFELEPNEFVQDRSALLTVGADERLTYVHAASRIRRLDTDGSIVFTVTLPPELSLGSFGIGPIASDSVGRIVAVRVGTAGSDTSFALTRLNADGTPDSGFVESGLGVRRVNQETTPRQLAVLADGNIVAGVSEPLLNGFVTSFHLRVFNPHGQPVADHAFTRATPVFYPLARLGTAPSRASIRSDGTVALTTGVDFILGKPNV